MNKEHELFNKQNLPTAEEIYDNPFIVNNYLTNYTLKDIDGDLVYVDNKTGAIVSGYIRLDPEDLSTLEQELSNINNLMAETYMNFKKLNEELNKFLEGDVVSFTDFKNRKVAERRKERSQEFLKQHDAEMQKSLDDFNQSNSLVTIDKVKILSCEGPIDNPHFENGEEFSYENFQERLYTLDYFNQIKDTVDKLDFEVYISFNDGTNQIQKLRCDIGDGREACDVYETLEMILSQQYDKNIMITNDPVKYNENYYKSLTKEYGIVAPKEEDPMDASYVKDYSKGGTKTAVDVEVGDILYQIGGYSMTYYNYYKVIDKKNKSIKLASLGEKIVDGDGWRGTCIPDNNIVPDKDVDDKLFRIGAKYNDKVVCQVNGHACYYWDGKPDSFDRMD